MRFVSVAAALAAVMLAGCAELEPYLNKSLEPLAAKTLRRIAIVETPEPERYVAFDLGHPGMLMGIGSFFVTGSSMTENGAQFTSALRGRRFEIGRRLTESTASALAAHGYEVTRIGPHALDVEADAVLRMTPDTVGYIAPRVYKGYEPALGVVVELMPVGRDPDVPALYRDRLMFGWETISGMWVNLPAPEQFSYRTFDELMKRSTEAADGLMIGADLIAERIAQDLARPR